ncbi:MAG TPA: NAD(P)-dependent oxidoreductase [Gaiellaceae bacterium]|nr:NAD(P)-dependent oxidoreductase [Gaiellaceae bacterium]
MVRIAFVGLGTMGLPMARNLVAAGYQVVGVDPDAGRLAALGAGSAETPAEAAAAADVALLSLPSAEAVEEVVLGARGLAAGASRGFAVVDMSTSPPGLARSLAAALATEGADWLDAPVSGGPRAAEAASLTIMVGGGHEAFERLRPLLERLGSLVVRVGPAGAGQAAKLCNNLVAGATMAALAEACALAVREGIEPRVLYELLTRSTGDSRVLRMRFPLAGVERDHPASRAYEPLFALDLMAKDLDLVLELAEAHGVATPVARAGRASYAEAQKRGLGRHDYSAVYAARTP